ncbi:MAG: hypothetical protein K6F50_06805 [Kiritimatiellae bacterium]|nr:hypothetical protein [Kiritimatiellia bacterium]
MNLTEEMRKASAGLAAAGGKTAAELAEENKFIAECVKRNPFNPQYLNLTNQMRLMSISAKLGEMLKAEAAMNNSARVAALQKAVLDMGYTLNEINDKM